MHLLSHTLCPMRKIPTKKFYKLVNKVYKGKVSKDLFANNNGTLYSFHDHIFNRSVKLYHQGKTRDISKPRLRNISGRSLIPSNNYSVTVLGKSVHLKGRGYGHGVGLCQMGTFELAKRGYSYKEILAYYFI